MKFFGISLLFLAASYAQSPLTITSLNLPSGSIGAPYSTTLTATGGTTPYTWSRSGTLPPGLTLNSNGTLVGTPTTAGSYGFTAVVVDGRQNVASAAVSISIGAAGSRISITTPSTLPAGNTGQPYSQTLTATGGSTPYRW